MAVNRTPVVIGSIIALAVIAVAVAVSWSQHYGEVAPETYQFAKALYSACLNENPEHLNKIQTMARSSTDASVPAHERKWIHAIINKAESGDWSSAARQAKRIMTDQIKR